MEVPLANVLHTLEHTRFHPGYRLFTWHPVGCLNDAVADQLLSIIEIDELVDARPFHRYTDLSQLATVQLTIGHMFRTAERRRQVDLHVKSAIYANTAVGLGIARMYEALMKDAHIEVRAFTDREPAAAWLGVPIEIIEPAAKP